MDQAKTLREVVNEQPKAKNYNARVIAVSSGKGGVGKSNITLNLAVEMAKRDKKVVILDNFSTLDKMYDIILIDTGAGVSDNVLNFIRASRETIIVATPEPTSLTDAYALLKSVNYVSDEDELPKFYIIVNKTDNAKEGHEVFNKLYSVCNNFLKINLDLLGFIPNDYQLLKAVKSQQPAVLTLPKSSFSKAMDNIAESILSQNVTIAETSGISIFMNRLISIFKS